MQEKTDLQQIKGVAKTLLLTTIHKTDYSPEIVQHPFTNSGYVMTYRENGKMEMYNILESQENLREWQNHTKNRIDKAPNAYAVYSMVNKPYAITFLKYAEPYLSRKDFSEILADAWVIAENPNCDANVTKSTLVAFFKQAEPSELMTEQERELLAELDDTVTVYRGVTPRNAKNIRALSWSLDYDKAEWFASRYGDGGTVYEAQIEKKHILALFQDRGESEVVVDPKYLTDITEGQSPNQNLIQTM